MEILKYVFLLYYLIVAFISIVITIHDKNSARRGRWRVSEATLMGIGLIGGALPMLVTMKLIRHKTKHMKFMIGLPAEMVLHLVIIGVVIHFFG